MSNKGSSPPGGRRTYSPGLGGLAVPRLGEGRYRGPRLNQRKKQTQAQIYSGQTLAVAAALYRQTTPIEHELAIAASKNGGLCNRDILYAVMYGTMYEISTTDGRTFYPWRPLMKEIQTLLDSITTATGTILVRTATGWAGLFPGSATQVLTINGSTGLPDWEDQASGGGGGVTFPVPTNWTPNTQTTFGAGHYAARCIIVQDTVSITDIQFFAPAAVTTATITPGIYAMDVNTPGALLATGPTVTGVVKGLNTIPLDAPYTAAKGDVIAVGVNGRTTNFLMCGDGTTNGFFFSTSSDALPPSAGSPSWGANGYKNFWPVAATS